VSPRQSVRLLADCEWMREPPPQSLVDGTGLTAGALAAIYSAPGVGKTFVTMSLATAVAIAPDWLGFKVVSPKPVVYAVGEGQAAFPLRLSALRTAYELRDDEPSGVWYVRESFSLLNPDDITALLDGIREHLAGEAPGLVVLDPLASFMGGGDENDTKDMSAAVAALNRIRAETGACVLVLHHSGWSGDRERGSIALRAAMDVLYKLTQEDGILTLDVDKLRDGATPGPLHLRLRSVAGSCVVELSGAPDVQQVTTLTAKQHHVLDALKAVVVDEPVTYTRWKDAAGTADTTFDRTMALLVRSGYVKKYGMGHGARYAPPGPLPPTPTSPPSHPHGGALVTPTRPRGPVKAPGGGKGDSVDTECESDELPPF
jgi:hypothetical protein